jgi:hypothetical protein
VRERIVRAFRFLQAQHIGFALAQEAFDIIDPETDGIDVPCGDGEAH